MYAGPILFFATLGSAQRVNVQAVDLARLVFGLLRSDDAGDFGLPVMPLITRRHHGARGSRVRLQAGVQAGRGLESMFKRTVGSLCMWLRSYSVIAVGAQAVHPPRSDKTRKEKHSDRRGRTGYARGRKLIVVGLISVDSTAGRARARHREAKLRGTNAQKGSNRRPASLRRCAHFAQPGRSTIVQSGSTTAG